MFLRDGPEELEETWVRRDAAVVAHQRLTDQRGDLSFVPGEGFAHAVHVVPLRDDGVARGQLTFSFVDGLARTGDDLLRGRMIAEQHAVVPTVVVAFELDELAAACRGAR